MTSQNVCTEFDLNIIEHEQHKRQHRRRRTGAKGDYVLAILVSLILQKFRKIISCFCQDFSVFSTSLPHQQYALSMNMPLSAKRSGWTLALCRRGRDWRELGKSTIVPEDHFYCRRKRGKSELKFGHSGGVKISKDRGNLHCALRARIPVIFQPPPPYTPGGNSSTPLIYSWNIHAEPELVKWLISLLFFCLPSTLRKGATIELHSF